MRPDPQARWTFASGACCLGAWDPPASPQQQALSMPSPEPPICMIPAAIRAPPTRGPGTAAAFTFSSTTGEDCRAVTDEGQHTAGTAQRARQEGNIREGRLGALGARVRTWRGRAPMETDRCGTRRSYADGHRAHRHTLPWLGRQGAPTQPRAVGEHPPHDAPGTRRHSHVQ